MKEETEVGAVRGRGVGRFFPLLTLLLVLGCAPVGPPARQRTTTSLLPDGKSTPTEAGLRGRATELLGVAAQGNRAAAASFFPGGEYPSHAKESWNRYMINALCGQLSKLPEVDVVFARAEGYSGMTVALPSRFEEAPSTEQPPGGLELFWRFMDGAWWVVEPTEAIRNPSAEERMAWNKFLQESASWPCESSGSKDALVVAEKVVAAAAVGDVTALLPHLSAHHYYESPRTSWSRERFDAIKASGLLHRLRGAMGAQCVPAGPPTKSTLVLGAPARLALNEDTAQACTFVIRVNYSTVEGQSGSLSLILCREAGGWRLWDFM